MATQDRQSADYTEEAGSSRDTQAENLRDRALSRPAEALTAARQLLASNPTPYQAALAHQASGIVLRDRSESASALAELRLAVAAAIRSGRTDLVADIRATLGTTLALSGRTAQGLRELDLAVTASRGSQLGRSLLRRGAILNLVGSYSQALLDLDTALDIFSREKDEVVWRARALTWRADVLLVMGNVDRAQADFLAAEQMFREVGQHYESAIAHQNLGVLARYLGDLPTALTRLAEAAVLYSAVESDNPDLVTDRCATLIAAGLSRDAMREAVDACQRLAGNSAMASKQAEFLHIAAEAALAVPDPAEARQLASRAHRLFVSQRRDLWAARADLVIQQARFAADDYGHSILGRVRNIAEQTANRDPELARAAHLLAAKISLASGSPDAAAGHLTGLARARLQGVPRDRSQGWLAQALLAESQGRSRAAVFAVRAGLSALDEHLATLGSSELKAHATRHGAELATIGLRLAVRHGTARTLLLASERWRAASLAVPNGPQRRDPELVTRLTALRAVTRQLERNRRDGAPIAAQEREIRRLERAIRERALQTSGQGSTARHLDIPRLIDLPPHVRLASLVDVEGTLHVVTVAGGRVRHHELGALPTRALDHSRFLLRRLAGGSLRWNANELLDQLGETLQRDLLGPAARDLAGDGPVVIVPPGTLHTVPWSLLPVLREREVSVAPSVTSWQRGRVRPAPDGEAGGRVAFVVGPGLGSGAGEVAPLAARYPESVSLGGGTATVPAVLAALDGAWLGHIAAHGTFRTDNPLFSALLLDDGPLTVHDIEQLDTAPHRLVLACCDSGIGLPAGADELIGLVSSLLQLGAVGVLAAVVPINDPATVPLMVSLHGALAEGASLPRALLQARLAGGDDPVAMATGYSFLAFGS